MAITRRTARFDDVATDVETECLHRGVMVRPELVDQVLNARIQHVAEVLRIGDRAALRYYPDDLGPQLAEQLVAALLEQPADGNAGPPTSSTDGRSRGPRRQGAGRQGTEPPVGRRAEQHVQGDALCGVRPTSSSSCSR